MFRGCYAPLVSTTRIRKIFRLFYYSGALFFVSFSQRYFFSPDLSKEVIVILLNQFMLLHLLETVCFGLLIHKVITIEVGDCQLIRRRLVSLKKDVF